MVSENRSQVGFIDQHPLRRRCCRLSELHSDGGGEGGGGVELGGWLGADYMNRAGLFWKYTKYQQVHGNKPMGDAGSPSCKLGSVQLNLKISVKRQTDPYGKAMKK